jgi:hypothetical protein
MTLKRKFTAFDIDHGLRLMVDPNLAYLEKLKVEVGGKGPLRLNRVVPQMIS